MAGKTFEQTETDLKRAWQQFQAGRHAEAERTILSAAEAGHSSPILCLLMVETAKRDGREQDMLHWYRKAMDLSPTLPQIRLELADLLSRRGDLDAAEAVLAEGVRLVPDSVLLLRALGRHLEQVGRAAEGIPFVQKAVSLWHQNIEGYIQLGVLYFQEARYAEAEKTFRTAIALNNRHVPLLNNLAATFRVQGNIADAERTYRRVLEIDPAYPDAPSNLGALLRETGRIDEAKQMYRRALQLRSPWATAHSNLIFCLDFDSGSGMGEQLAERARWRQALEAPLAAQRYRHAAGDPAKRLRIGYMSADFRRHSASDMFGGILLNHDLDRLDIYLYSHAGAEDERTRLFREHATLFRRVRGLSDEILAATIKEDEVDILVDLSGHSAGNRLPVFARKPAPVQVTAWGYATGTGLETIDYFLADPWLVPEALRPEFAETIIDLSCFLTYRVPEDLPAPGPSPCLAAGHVTFGCLNRLAKASTACLESWADLLERVPRSRLILKCQSLGDDSIRRRVAEIFTARGLAADRLDLRGGSPHAEHVKTYLEIDIALDPFPHCGGTTTCEALAMGLPVVSLCGEVPVARNGLSLLSALGHPEWVATDRDGYLDRAVALASDPDKLQALRAGLREEVLACPLGDNIAYTREVESVYRRLWETHCQTLAADEQAHPA